METNIQTKYHRVRRQFIRSIWNQCGRRRSCNRALEQDLSEHERGSGGRLGGQSCIGSSCMFHFCLFPVIPIKFVLPSTLVERFAYRLAQHNGQRRNFHCQPNTSCWRGTLRPGRGGGQLPTPRPPFCLWSSRWDGECIVNLRIPLVTKTQQEDKGAFRSTLVAKAFARCLKHVKRSVRLGNVDYSRPAGALGVATAVVSFFFET